MPNTVAPVDRDDVSREGHQAGLATPRLGPWGYFVVVYVGYGIATQVGLLLIPEGGVSSFWPAAGFAAVMLLWAGSARRRSLTLAAVLLSYVTLTVISRSYGASEVGFTLANTVEPLLMLPFLRRATREDGRLTNLTSLGWLVLGAVLAPMASGLIASGWAMIVGLPDSFMSVWVGWWAGDALGLLVFAPVMLQTRPVRNLWSLGRPWEQALVWGLFAIGTLQLATGPAIGLITLAGLVLVGLRLDTAAASVAAFIAAATMAWLSLEPTSVFQTSGAGANIDGRVLILITVLTAQLVALGTSARRRATAERDAALASALVARAEAERANESLAESETTLRRALDSGLDAFAIYQRDSSGEWRLVYANTEASRRAGLRGPVLAGTTLEVVAPIEAVDRIRSMMDQAEASGETQKLIADLRKSISGWQGHFSITASPTRDGRVVVTWRDVTDEQATQQKLRSAHAAAMHAATHDSLTNLPNRGLFRDRLTTSLAALSRSGQRVALVFVDLDDFKAVNDRYGHLAGDTALMTLAQRLSALVRDSVSVARLGGDVFVILLPAIETDWSPEEFHMRLSACLSPPIMVGGGEVTIQASVGVVVVDSLGPSGDELLHMADVAMYTSKARGKGQLTVWSNNLSDTPSPRRIGTDELQAALEDDELFLDYQPIYDLTTDHAVGFEALIRWRHPILGVLPPDHFLGLAEDLGLGVRVGEWVIDRAITDLTHVDPDKWISINLSARHLAQRDVAGYLATQLSRRDNEAMRLVVELTESQLLSATPAAIQRLEEIRDLGVRVAIDDFGSGYSSLAYLEALPFDVVKIDRGLITGTITARKAELLTWVNQLSVMLDATLILEGIETSEQLALARQSHVKYGQGYLLGRPGPLPAHRARTLTAS